MGPAAELAQNGDKYDALLGAIEVAFRFVNVPGDEESADLAKILESNSAEEVVQKVSGLTESDKLYADVVKVVEKVQKK